MNFIAKIKRNSATAKKLEQEKILITELWGVMFTKDIFGEFSAELKEECIGPFFKNPEIELAIYSRSSLGEGGLSAFSDD